MEEQKMNKSDLIAHLTKGQNLLDAMEDTEAAREALAQAERYERNAREEFNASVRDVVA